MSTGDEQAKRAKRRVKRRVPEHLRQKFNHQELQRGMDAGIAAVKSRLAAGVKVFTPEEIAALNATVSAPMPHPKAAKHHIEKMTYEEVHRGRRRKAPAKAEVAHAVLDD